MSVSGRAQASKLAPTDSKAAFAVAERIEDPWYAAQAFATVTRHAHGPIRAKAFAASRAAARRGKDTYQQAAVLAWPLRAAIELGEEKLAEAIFVDASALLPAINNFSLLFFALFASWRAKQHRDIFSSRRRHTR